MNVPPTQHPVWTEILSGKRAVQFESIAIRMLVVSLRLTMQLDPGDACRNRCVGELRQLFITNAGLSSMQHDLAKLAI